MDYFSHDKARSRAYHWGEDGLAGVSDHRQRLCFALALWKKCYYYLDKTPTHSHMKYLYKYPQGAYPYVDLINTNRHRSRLDPEYELIDTGIFKEDRYFDVFAEYGKASPTDLLIRISVCNRGTDESVIHVLPTLWFRNIWTWWPEAPTPSLTDASTGNGVSVIAASDSLLGTYFLYYEGAERVCLPRTRPTTSVSLAPPIQHRTSRMGSNDFVVGHQQNAVNPNKNGTKASAHYQLRVGAKATTVIRLRLSNAAPGVENPFGLQFAQIIGARRREADEFYRAITPPGVGEDRANVMRQALAGMLWGKQYFFYDVDKWLEEHRADALLAETATARNREWFHMIADHVISMPDKWEYPWFAAWDLAFHTVALSTVDIDFAKQQLDLLLVGAYQHPNAEIPAYEWNFSDVNPPVHGWATIFVYRMEQALRERTDLEFLRRVFSKLTTNFGWWASRKDSSGNNLYEGEFLGLDHIGVFDRSRHYPLEATWSKPML